MIREATAADTPRLVEMTTRFVQTTGYGALVQPDPQCLEALIALILAHGVILVEERTIFGAAAPLPWTATYKLVGMIGLVALPHPLTGQLYADEQAWWVEPEHRNGAIGPRLLKAAEQWARQQGCQSVKMVAPAGGNAAKYYTRVGYLEVETAFVKILT